MIAATVPRGELRVVILPQLVLHETIQNTIIIIFLLFHRYAALQIARLAPTSW
jgi:hypothetical protein